MSISDYLDDGADYIIDECDYDCERCEIRDECEERYK